MTHCGAKDPQKLASVHKECSNAYKFYIITLTFCKCIFHQTNYINFNLQGKFSVTDLPSLRINFNYEIQYLY